MVFFSRETILKLIAFSAYITRLDKVKNTLFEARL
jgi:hypothetical protein